jgi:LysM repeat protein
MQNKRFTILLVFVLSFLFKFSQAQTSEAILSYIARYKDLAMIEMQRTGVPAAITLAQGIHETEAGTSILVKKSNNHFGIKCKAEWTGQSVSHDDDARGECFRKYADPSDSYKDHSDFLKTRPNYASLFNLDPTDFEAWAYGLKKAGYATNPKYPQILIKLIRDYNLQDYTLIAMGKMKQPEVILAKNNPVIEEKKTGFIAASTNSKVEEEKVAVAPIVSVSFNYPEGEFKINDTRVLFIKEGTSYLSVAQQYEIPLARLFEFNDMKSQEVAANDQLIYIQRKRKTGDHEFHVVKPGENLYSIAQTEAVRMESLLEYNNLGPGMQPAAGETLYLRSKSGTTPKLASIKNTVAENDLTNINGQSVAMNNSGYANTSNLESKNNIFFFHQVQPKETVYSIAKKYNVSFDDIANWNQLQGFDLKIGQSLKIYNNVHH